MARTTRTACTSRPALDLIWPIRPALLIAQRRAAPAGGARHEFGVDLGAAYTKPKNIDGGITIGTPLAVRVGFVSRSKLMWEPRVTLDFSTVGGTTTYLLTPDVNV